MNSERALLKVLTTLPEGEAIWEGHGTDLQVKSFMDDDDDGDDYVLHLLKECQLLLESQCIPLKLMTPDTVVRLLFVRDQLTDISDSLSS